MLDVLCMHESDVRVVTMASMSVSKGLSLSVWGVDVVLMRGVSVTVAFVAAFSGIARFVSPLGRESLS